ncbi:MAG: hypothetical protein FWE65_00350, partial [Eggerthellaceae bacterium]|nr:hypothetical protein [Eggerthellaceae bacterium]
LRNYDWDNFDPADFIEPLGDATFAVDYENSDTGEFLADGETPLILSVTDNAGAVWTLEVPANALLSPETLTMTVLRDVRLAGEGLDGGVLLSPSGLAFFEPAMLRVTGEGCGEDSVIYEGAHDGRNMSITEYKAGEGYVCATVWHFSTRTKVNGKGGGASVSMLQLLVDMGNEILRQPLSAPEPPSSTFKCPEYHNTDNAALRAYSSKVADPELVAIQTIQRALANYRGKDALVAQAMDMVVKLEERFADKVNMLIYQYRGQEDKFMAISMLAFYSGNRDTLKGGIDYEEIYSWGKEVWNELMQELVEGHDYTRAHSLRQLKTFIVFICTLRDVPIDADAFDQKLSNALTFWVEWELHTDTIGLVIMESSSEALVSMEQQTGEAGLSGDGTGDGRIDNYSVGDDRKAKPQVSFSVNARLSNLDPCMSNSITVGLDNPGATDFDVVFDTTGRSEYKEFLVQRAFEDKLDEGFYTFELPLINLQEKCAEKKESGKYEESGATFTADITISLYHAPKDDVYIN